MGCDIHFYVEITRDGDTWEYLPGGAVMTCDGCMGGGKAPLRCRNCAAQERAHLKDFNNQCVTSLSVWDPAEPEECYDCAGSASGVGTWEDWSGRFYTGRNYDLFGVLADVRGNTDPEFTDLRGMPPDVSEGVARAREGYGDDGHSDTYYLLDELLTYPWRTEGFDAFHGSLKRIEDTTGEMGIPAHRVRAVMWFDN